MSYELLAKFASLDEDEECLSFAFSADEFDAGKYVMFQYPLKHLVIHKSRPPPSRHKNTFTFKDLTHPL